MNKLSLVKTFGGAVTHLEETFKTLEFPKIKKRILKYIKDNPEDSETSHGALQHIQDNLL